MAGRWKDFDADHAVRLRESGMGVVEVARHLGVGYERVRKALMAAGVPTHAHRVRTDIPWGEVRTLFANGESVLALSRRFGVSRDAIVSRVGSGRRARGRSDAERIKWARIMTDRSAVERQCAAAWDATRGCTRSAEEKRRAAVTNFLRQTRHGLHEDALFGALSALGLEVVQQFPAACYNIDLAICADRVAVEILGSYPKSPGTVPYAERVPQIIDAGWRILYIGAMSKRAFDMPWVCQQILAFRDFSRDLEPGRCEQWMLFSDRKDSPRVRAKLHEISGVSCSAYPQHVT